MNNMKLKYPGVLPIGFFTFAAAAVALSVTVVPQPQVDQVLHIALMSGAFGVVSLQMWSLQKQLEELRLHQQQPSAAAKPGA
jgi:hypothetical protein